MELQGNASTEVMTLRMPSSPIPIAGLGIHLEHVNLRGNHNAFKKYMTLESDTIIDFYSISQEHIHSPPCLLTNAVMPATTIITTQPPLWVA
jgi:hypothetical protein